MKQSQLFTKTLKTEPKDEISKNARLLIRGGFIHKEMAGVYSFLPLGLKVLEKIKNIIREELNKIGALEIKMTALQKKEVWEPSGRWSDKIVDDWFKTKLKNQSELGLAFTHEEPITNIMKNFISSYKDLPIYAYQFQTKFRNELRAKSGLLRSREFLMKDLYDFSPNKKEHEKFYEKMKQVYMKIFKRVGIGDQTFLTISSGGSFSKYSYEFQTLTPAGEDIILLNREKKIAINKNDFTPEIKKDFNINKKTEFEEVKSAEVGDIYTLGEKFSKALNLRYKDPSGKEHYVYMGSYGIGVPRLMGVAVEVFSDNKGIIWPDSIAPFKVHLISLNQNQTTEKIYKTLRRKKISVLYDDRKEKRAGEKFADADLIGCPIRIVISEKTLINQSAEVKKRNSSQTQLIKIKELNNFLEKI